MKKFFLLFIAILFLGLASCSSEDPKPETKCLVTKQINANGNYIEYTYNGDLAVKVESKTASGKILLSTEYQYNGTKRTRLSQFDHQTGTPILTYLLIEEYAGNNLVKRQSSNYDRTSKLTGQSTTISEFDANGNKVKDVTTNLYTEPSGATSTFESMTTYEYNGKLMIKQNRFSKNRTTNQFVLSSFSSFEHDSNGNVIVQKSYISTGQLFSTTTNTYSSTNKILKVVREVSGKSYVSALYEYDAKDNSTLTVFFEEDGKKSYENKITYEYDSKGNITKSVTVNNNYYDPNTGGVLAAPFTSITTTFTYEYQCPK